MGEHYRQREMIFAQTMADRQEWEHATAHSRRLAVAADAELRRRHPSHKIEPLRSAEPAPVSGRQNDQSHLELDTRIGEMSSRIRDLEIRGQAFRAALQKRQALKVLNNDRRLGDLGNPFASWRTPGQDAILQPPKPSVAPSSTILQRVAEHDAEPEAGS
jgi:hypothetical protein